MSRLVLIGGRVNGGPAGRVVIENGVITEIRRDLPATPLAGSIDVRGGTVLPGLWDHHVHLFAAASRRWSLDVTGIDDQDQFAERLRHAARQPHEGWVRAVGYDDETLGPLDSTRLDRLAPTPVPIKVQHRSGHQWVVNGAGRRALASAGVSVGPDGMLWDDDEALRQGQSAPRHLADAVRGLARRLASSGCVGVTDMSATSTAVDITALRSWLSPVLSLQAYGAPPSGLDGVKRVVMDHAYPSPDDVVRWLDPEAVNRVAAHAVTAEALALIASAAVSLGPHVRVEHAFLADDDLLAALAEVDVELGVHPGFIHSHGDRIRGLLSPEEQASYQRLASMKQSGMRMFGGTDSPFAPECLWQNMETAVTRRTASGARFDAAEALEPEDAFALFTRQGLQGSAVLPRLDVGQRADLCVIDRDWGTARSALSQTRVVLTVAAGLITWAAPKP